MSSVIEIDLCSLCVEGNAAYLEAYLTSEDFDPRSLFDKDSDGLIPYQLSILNGHPTCMDLLLKTNVDQEVTFQGLHPVHLVMSLAAFKEKQPLVIQMVQVLADHKQDISQRDRLGRSALHLLCMNGPADLVIPFISAGIKLETKDFAGKMPIHYAIEYNQPECLKIIIQEGGSDMFFCNDARGDKPIHVAVRAAAWDCFEVLLSFAFEEMLNELNEFEQTPAEVARNCGVYQEFLAATNGIKTKASHKTMVFTDELCYLHAGFSGDIRKRFDWFKFLMMQPENPVRLERILGCSSGISMKMGVDGVDSGVSQVALPESEVHLCSELLESNPDHSIQSDANFHSFPRPQLKSPTFYISNGPAGSLMTDEFSDLTWKVSVNPASIADIIRVHEYSYIKRLQDFISKLTPGSLPSRFDVDTRVTSESFQSALHAAGAVIDAVDSVLQGLTQNAFCCVRPPGHHVGPFGAVSSEEDPSLTSNGFCLFNNVSIGAAYSKYMYSKLVQKVAILDFDVHHGNGTEAIVRNLRPTKLKMPLNLPMALGCLEYDSYKPWLSEDDAKNVLFISSHAYGREGHGFFYPASGTACTGEDLFPGGVVNIPLQKATDSLTFRKCKF
jgi:acetoin utilization deacetylase AcuC-like enzyme